MQNAHQVLGFLLQHLVGAILGELSAEAAEAGIDKLAEVFLGLQNRLLHDVLIRSHFVPLHLGFEGSQCLFWPDLEMVIGGQARSGDAFYYKRVPCRHSTPFFDYQMEERRVPEQSKPVATDTN